MNQRRYKGNGELAGDKAPASVGRKPGTKVISCTVTDDQLAVVTAQLAGCSLSNWLRSLVFQATAMPQQFQDESNKGAMG
jgi:hypothetical protein